MSYELSLPALPLNGRFTDLHLIGTGASARVFKARDLSNQNLVAVKILRPEVATLRGKARFDREIRIIRALIHPNVLTLIDAGTIDEGQFEGCPFFVMPLVSGESLRSALHRARQLSVQQAVRIVTGVARGLAAAHAMGIVHRDVKPENVLLDGDSVLVADFGIARVSDSEGGMTSSTGVIVGTPLYMSPEQISGDRDLDQRSDIYSLGILFYELLAGNTPFTGSSPQAITARHLIEPPPPLRVVRPDVDRRLADVIVRSLAKVPAGRQPSCEAFLQEVSDALTPSKRLLPRTTLKMRAVSIGVVALAISLGFVLSARRTGPTLDSARVLVLPLHRPSAQVGFDAEDRLRSAFREWTGLQVVDNLETGEDAQPALSLPEAAKRGRAIGAGLVVTGRLVERQGSIHLTATLLDVTAAPRVLRASGVSWKTNSAPSDSTFRTFSDSLLVPPIARGVSSRSYPAVLAFSDGLTAIDEWDLSYAESAFERATRADQGFAHGMLWLALVRTWLERPLPEWSYLVVRARERGAAVLGTDSAKLTALGSQAAGDLPGACRIWRQLTVTSPADYASWYGLADCLRRDVIVVRDRATPGGWRFRASHNGAIAAYRRALELIPGSHRSLSNKSFESVRRFMLTSMTDFVVGHNESGSLQFAGLPALDGDSLVLRPILLSDLLSGKADVMPSSHRVAVANQRRMFDSLTASWAAAFPESSDALLARAISLEMLGDERMLATITEARKQARLSPEMLHAGVAHVRMLVKRGLESRESLVAGKALADSLIVRFHADTTVDPTAVANLAALTGRVYLAAQLLRRRIGAASNARTSLEAQGAVLLLYAASGVSKDSVGAISQRVDHLIQQQEPAHHSAMRMTWIARAATLSFPDTLPVEAHALRGHGDYLLDAQLEVLRGDRASAVRSLTSIVATRTAPPGDIPLDAVCPEANTLAIAGDGRTALKWMREALSSLSLAPPDLFVDGTVAAVLGRCLSMAADLAASAGERAVADRWRMAAQVLTGPTTPRVDAVPDAG